MGVLMHWVEPWKKSERDNSTQLLHNSNRGREQLMMRVVRRLRRRKRRQRQPDVSSRGKLIALKSFVSAKLSLRRPFLKDSVSSTSNATRDLSIASIRS